MKPSSPSLMRHLDITNLILACKPPPSRLPSPRICPSCLHSLRSTPSTRTLTRARSHQTQRTFSTSSSPLFFTTSRSQSQSQAQSQHPPLNIETHYTLFPSTIPGGPPPSSPFEIPFPALRREFLQLQAKYHPDKFPPDQKVRAEAISSRINTAYKTLADPLHRAQYLLNDFHGIDVLAEDQGSAQQNPETLMEVMEAQEAIEEAGGEEEIEVLKDANRARIDDTVKRLAEAFDSGEIEDARKECIKLRFWRSLQEGLDNWEPGKEVRLIH